MNSLAPTLKALLKQATLNAQLLHLIAVLAVKSELGDSADDVLAGLQEARKNSKEVLEAIKVAVEKLEQDTNG